MRVSLSGSTYFTYLAQTLYRKLDFYNGNFQPMFRPGSPQSKVVVIDGLDSRENEGIYTAD